MEAIHVANDYDTPESVPGALTGPEKEEWEEWIVKEVMQFMRRKFWRKVSKKVTGQTKRKILKRLY
jgi:hypothetical protein